MDEPFGALDPDHARRSWATRVRGLHASWSLTTVMVTHDMAEALLLANRVLVMDGGRIVADETPAALLAGEGGDVAQALVDVPREQARQLAGHGRMSALLDAILDLGPQLAEHVLLCAAAVALGIAVALPLAVWASRSPTVARSGAGLRQPGADHPRPRAAGAVLPHPAGCAHGVRRGTCRRWASCPHGWRWRCMRCCRSCATP